MQILTPSLNSLGFRKNNPYFFQGLFTQSLGSELLVNGDFSAWTANNPDGYTVTGESGSDPEISQVAPGNTHGGGGTGAANFFSSATTSQPRLQQTIMSVGDLYRFNYNMTARANGVFAILGANLSGNAFNSVRMRHQMGRASSITIQHIATGAAPHDFTMDDLSVKKINPNEVQIMVSDGAIEVYFDRPISPISNQEFHVLYRFNNGLISDAMNNCWDFFLRRQDSNLTWDALLQVVNGGTRAAGTSQGTVGNPIGMRVEFSGSTHRIYTREASTDWIQRGSTVTNALWATGTNALAVYNENFTPLAFVGIKQ